MLATRLVGGFAINVGLAGLTLSAMARCRAAQGRSARVVRVNKGLIRQLSTRVGIVRGLRAAASGQAAAYTASLQTALQRAARSEEVATAQQQQAQQVQQQYHQLLQQYGAQQQEYGALHQQHGALQQQHGTLQLECQQQQQQRQQLEQQHQLEQQQHHQQHQQQQQQYMVLQLTHADVQRERDALQQERDELMQDRGHQDVLIERMEAAALLAAKTNAKALDLERAKSKVRCTALCTLH